MAAADLSKRKTTVNLLQPDFGLLSRFFNRFLERALHYYNGEITMHVALNLITVLSFEVLTWLLQQMSLRNSRMPWLSTTCLLHCNSTATPTKLDGSVCTHNHAVISGSPESTDQNPLRIMNNRWYSNEVSLNNLINLKLDSHPCSTLKQRLLRLKPQAFEHRLPVLV